MEVLATEMSSSMYEPKTAKKVYLYRNGVINADPKCLIVNQKQVRDFGSFLNRATSGLKAPVAIRNIYTPAGGHKIKSLDSLESGRYYVAGGSEQFKKIKYGSTSPQKLLPRRPHKELYVPSRMQQAVVASSRYKQPTEKPFVIHVFRNGDSRYRGARVLLPRRIMASWEHVLEIVTEKAELFTPAKRLCTLDGHIVHAVSELQDGGKYVVLEGTKPFQRVPYCATEDTRVLMHTAPKPAIRLHRRPRRKPNVNDDGIVSDLGKTPMAALSQSLKPHKLERRKSRPMAGRKNKEAREKAIEDHRADSIFGGSPTRGLDTSIEAPLINPTKPKVRTAHHPLSKASTLAKETSSSEDTDSLDTAVGERKPGVFHASDGGKQKETRGVYVEETQGDTLFKAKAQRADVEDAEVVVESQDTEVERPLDLEEPEVVEEEETKEESHTNNKVSQLQAPPQHTSIDLSLNRTKPTTTPTPTTTTAADEQTDSEEMPSDGMAKDDPKPTSRGSIGSKPSSHQIQLVDDSNASKDEKAVQKSEEEESGEKKGEEKSSSVEPKEGTVKEDSGVVGGGDVGADGEVSNPPDELTIEEEVTEMKEVEKPGQKDENTSDITKDETVEVSEELEPPPSPPAPAGEPEASEPQPTEGLGDSIGEEQAGVDPAMEASVPEEIVEEVQKPGQDDVGGQNENDVTTTFVVENLQES